MTDRLKTGWKVEELFSGGFTLLLFSYNINNMVRGKIKGTS